MRNLQLPLISRLVGLLADSVQCDLPIRLPRVAGIIRSAYAFKRPMVSVIYEKVTMSGDQLL